MCTHALVSPELALVFYTWHLAFAYQPHVGVEDAIIFHAIGPTAQ